MARTRTPRARWRRSPRPADLEKRPGGPRPVVRRKDPGKRRGPRRRQGTLSPSGTAALSLPSAPEARGVRSPWPVLPTRWRPVAQSGQRTPRGLNPPSCAGRAEAALLLWTRPLPAVHTPRESPAERRPGSRARRGYAPKSAFHERPRTPVHRSRRLRSRLAPPAGLRVAAPVRPLLRRPGAVGPHRGRRRVTSRWRRCGPTPVPPRTRTTWSAAWCRVAAGRCWTPRWTRAGSCARATRSGARRSRSASSRSRCAGTAGCSG